MAPKLLPRRGCGFMTAAFRPRHLSVSSVQTYVRCAAQYKARYVDRLVTPTSMPQAWGTAFHKALEALHRGQDAEMAWIKAWNAASGAFSPAVFMPGKMHGLELLEAFRARGLDTVKGEPEQKFVLPFPSRSIPVPLLGYIDFCAPEDRHYRDYKTTSGSSWTQTKVDLEPQVHVYGWAYQKLYRHRADRALWVIFSTVSPTITPLETVPSPDGFRLFEQTAESVWRGITEGRYEGCGECDVCNPPVEKAAGNPPAFVWEG